MVSRVIHHQYHSPGWVLCDQQVLQKVDELRAVLGFGNCPGDGIVDPMVATKHMPFLFDPGRVAGISFCCPIFIQQALSGG